jgi:WD40 repeat protein
VISIAHSHGLRSLVATEEQIVSGGGTTDNVVKVWNLNSRICEDSISSPHIYGVSALAVSWDKRYLVTSGLDDEFIKVWKFEIKEYITKIPRCHKTNLTVMGITPGNEHLITGAGDGTIKIWKFLNHEPMLTIENCHSTISGITLSSDGNFFFSSSNEDPIFKIWNIHNGKCVHSFELPLQGKSTAVCISRNW